jgi:hypothetical protein
MDLTRYNEYMQKKGVCVFAGVVEEGTQKGQIEKDPGNHLLANLPPNAIITDAYVHVITASNATTYGVTLGTASGGAQILSAANGKTAGKQGTFAGQVFTDTGVELWLNVTRTGTGAVDAKYVVVVEYLEFDKNTGEYTKV